MDDIYGHMRAWGCPDPYCRDYPEVGCHAVSPELRDLIEAVARTANWYPEQTRAVIAMALAGDARALRAWDRDALVRVGEETAMEDSPSADEYADDVMRALEALADAIAGL